MAGKVDRQALHEYLWKKRDRLNRVEIYQKELARWLGITQASMSVILSEMVSHGRLTKIATKQTNIGTYRLEDPALFVRGWLAQTP